ncbi:hypothetical protein G6F43_002890 [Rhizopus delemar]|nr:hypothetical protein G6F43_002890 [Rhizopus delemar]
MTIVKNILWPLPFDFKNNDGIKSLRDKYEGLDTFKPNGKQQVILKKICFVRLRLQSLLSKRQNFKEMLGTVTTHTVLEQSFRVLLWPKAKRVSAMVTEKDEVEFDVVNGEVASVSRSNRGKYYQDTLKLALSAKRHLNAIVSSLHSLTPKELPKIKLPIVQIMGMNCHISCLNLVDKNIYVLQDIYTFHYPRTIKQIKEGAIGDIMTGFLLIDNMITNVDDIYNNFSKDTHDKIELIKNEKKQKKSEACSDYFSAVEWDSSDDDASTDVDNESQSEDSD